ncbi:hypothetical protein LZ198_29380 [Myxococcus sp. K15C18031901]|uniref:hypothetical protein n=1 Tax=Myxococcus dinghuensis TaxID=2906761 RepID=UPI0020A70FF0|nr:hypothetical protein [Myxococcus dinghuensis]MCP3102999.1 hypothetical protein [Myxococcus dinghuensis]
MPQHARQRPPGPHRIHYSPQAWREVGRMPSEAFVDLQATLERLGEASVRGAIPTEPGTFRHVLARHGLVLDYAWDERSRTLTLLAVARGP